MGSQRIGHDRVTENTNKHTQRFRDLPRMKILRQTDLDKVLRVSSTGLQ